MSDEISFMRAILDEPDDVDLRLVFADWCENHGDPRAEFIRVQLALDKLPLRHAWRHDMLEREKTLLAEHGRAWNARVHRVMNSGPLKGRMRARRSDFRGWRYRRGFIEWLDVDAEFMLSHWKHLAEIGPIRYLRLRNAGKCLARLLTSPFVARMKGLDFTGGELGDAAVGRLVESGIVHNLEFLNLTGNMLTTVSVDHMLGCPPLKQLKALALSKNLFDRESIRRLTLHLRDRLCHENGDSFGLHAWIGIAEEMAPDSPREIPYDDHVNYSDGRMYADDGSLLRATDNPHDFVKEWDEETDHLDFFQDEEDRGKKYDFRSQLRLDKNEDEDEWY